MVSNNSDDAAFSEALFWFHLSLPEGFRTVARRDDIAKLRGLAGEVGYTVERAMRRSHWRLTDERGVPVVDPKTDATAFTSEAAMRFLGEVKSAPLVSGRRKPWRQQ